MCVCGGGGALVKGLANQWSSCKGITSVLQLHPGFHPGSLTNTINPPPPILPFSSHSLTPSIHSGSCTTGVTVKSGVFRRHKTCSTCLKVSHDTLRGGGIRPSGGAGRRGHAALRRWLNPDGQVVKTTPFYRACQQCRKFLHQARHFCRSLSRLSHANGVLAPLSSQRV